MKSLVFILAASFGLNAFATTYELICEYEFDTYTADELDEDFRMIGVETEKGIEFHKEITGIPSYYIDDRFPTAQWHHDSQMTFDAVLKNQELTYQFIYKNYLRRNDKLAIVYDETRALDMTEHFYEEELDFEYDDGEILKSYRNTDDWINERHVTMEDCELFIK